MSGRAQQRGAVVISGIYYTELANWIRGIGLRVVEYSGWQTRARSSGGFKSAPLGIQWHHTAGSGKNPQGDCDYMWRNSENRPVGNLYLAIDGTVWVGAAGAANTAGKGGPYKMSRGTVPLDQGNSTTFAIEAANAGTGQSWAQSQIDAYFKLSNMLNSKFGNQPSDLFTHQAYAPSRKIDPATANAVQGPWRPRSCTGSGTWDVSDVKAECSRRAGSTPEPGPEPGPGPTPPPSEGDEMTAAILKYGGTPTGGWSGWFTTDGGMSRELVRDPNHAALIVALGAVDGATHARVTDAEWDGVSQTLDEGVLNGYLGPWKTGAGAATASAKPVK